MSSHALSQFVNYVNSNKNIIKYWHIFSQSKDIFKVCLKFMPKKNLICSPHTNILYNTHQYLHISHIDSIDIKQVLINSFYFHFTTFKCPKINSTGSKPIKLFLIIVSLM